MQKEKAVMSTDPLPRSGGTMITQHQHNQVDTQADNELRTKYEKQYCSC